MNSSKNGRFRNELIGEAKYSIELLEVVVFIYHYSPKVGSFIQSATKRTQHRWILCAVLNFS